jgi:hypothetical protein
MRTLIADSDYAQAATVSMACGLCLPYPGTMPSDSYKKRMNITGNETPDIAVAGNPAAISGADMLKKSGESSPPITGSPTEYRQSSPNQKFAEKAGDYVRKPLPVLEFTARAEVLPRKSGSG